MKSKISEMIIRKEKKRKKTESQEPVELTSLKKKCQ